jgi:protease-4
LFADSTGMPVAFCEGGYNKKLKLHFKMGFSRRHPLLFSMLVICGLGAALVIGVTMLFVLSKRDTAFEFGENVGVIEIKGIIADPGPTLSHLREFRKNDNIKAVVLRIDSPGGGVGPSQEIYEEVKRTKRSKQVVVSMGAIAASGGYYVAAAADHIMANPGTITGSISVIMEFANLQALFEKIGVAAYVLKSGEYKDVGSPFREMTANEKKLMQAFIENVHGQFVTAVAEGRKMTKEQVETIADGRILSGEQAHKLGLLDSLGNLEDAIRLAGELGGIKGEPSVVYAKKKRFSLLEYFLGSSALTDVLDHVTASALHSGYLYMPGRL